MCDGMNGQEYAKAFLCMEVEVLHPLELQRSSLDPDHLEVVFPQPDDQHQHNDKEKETEREGITKSCKRIAFLCFGVNEVSLFSLCVYLFKHTERRKLCSPRYPMQIKWRINSYSRKRQLLTIDIEAILQRLLPSDGLHSLSLAQFFSLTFIKH